MSTRFSLVSSTVLTLVVGVTPAVSSNAAGASAVPTILTVRLRDLGTLGGATSWASAVDGRLVAGSAQNEYGATDPFSYDLADPGMHAVPTSGFGNVDTATAVDGRLIVGTYQPGTASFHAYTYDVDTRTLRDLGTFGGLGSSAYDVDDAVVVGAAQDPHFDSRAFFTDVTTPSPVLRDLGTLGGTTSTATAISGTQVVGTSTTTDGSTHAFATDISAPTPVLRDLGPTPSDAPLPDVDQGIAVATLATVYGRRAFAFDLTSPAVTTTDLGALVGLETEAVAVSGGTVVGSSYRTSGPVHALAWTLSRTSGPVLDLSRSTYSVRESARSATVTVIRRGDTSRAVRVRYAATQVQGGATARKDFEPTAGSLSFAAGQTRRSFRVTIRDDGLREHDERIALRLGSPSAGAALGTTRTATIVIGTSDQRPDAVIKRHGASRSVGAGIVNGSGAGQTVTLPVRRGASRAFALQIRNPPPPRGRAAAVAVRVRAARPDQASTVRYLLGAVDVTRAVRSSAGLRLTVDRWAGRTAVARTPLIIRFTAHRGARTGSHHQVWVSVVWHGDHATRDVVGAGVRVVR